MQKITIFELSDFFYFDFYVENRRFLVIFAVFRPKYLFILVKMVLVWYHWKGLVLVRLLVLI